MSPPDGLLHLLQEAPGIQDGRARKNNAKPRGGFIQLGDILCLLVGRSSNEKDNDVLGTVGNAGAMHKESRERRRRRKEKDESGDEKRMVPSA